MGYLNKITFGGTSYNMQDARITALSDSTSTTSSTSIATSTAVKAAYDHYPSNATTSAAGLMSASDKSKLDGLSTGYPTTTSNSSLSWNYEVRRAATATTSIAVTGTLPSCSAEVRGFFLASGTTCTFSANSLTIYTGDASGTSVAVTVTDGTVYEFSLVYDGVGVELAIKEWR